MITPSQGESYSSGQNSKAFTRSPWILGLPSRGRMTSLANVDVRALRLDASRSGDVEIKGRFGVYRGSTIQQTIAVVASLKPLSS